MVCSAMAPGCAPRRAGGAPCRREGGEAVEALLYGLVGDSGVVQLEPRHVVEQVFRIGVAVFAHVPGVVVQLPLVLVLIDQGNAGARLRRGGGDHEGEQGNKHASLHSYPKVTSHTESATLTHVHTSSHGPGPGGSEDWLELTDCRVDLATGLVVKRAGGQDQLREKERAALTYLVQRVGHTVSHEALLRDAWGYDADVVTRTLYTTMGRLREKVEADPTRPDHIVTVRGEGYQFVPAQGPSPVAPTLLGRDADIRRVMNQFDRGERLVTLLGPAGIGKTALARYLVVTSERPATLVDLSAATTMPALVSAVLASLGLAGSGRGSAEQGLGERIAARGPRLLVLDNFEGLVTVGAAAVGEWAQQASGVRFLVTSQVALRLASECVVALQGLAPAPAKALLVDRATRAGRAPAPAEAPAVDEIVNQLQGVPLALELAASRLRILPAFDLLERLRARGVDVLRGGWRDGPARHRSMEAALQSSWELLSDAGRRAAAQCTVFAVGFDLAAFEAVAEVPGADPLDVVAELQDHSWLRLRDGQLTMFDALRRFAGRHLDADDPAIRRHADWAQALEPSLGAVPELSLVLDRFVARDPERAAHAAVRIRDILVPLGHTDLNYDVQCRAGRAMAHVPDPLAAELGFQRVRAARRTFRFDEAREHLVAMGEVAARGGPDSHGRWWLERAGVELTSGQMDPAAEFLARSAALLGPLGPSRALGQLRSTEGLLAHFRGDTEGAIRLLREAVALNRRFGSEHQQARALGSLAMVLQGRWTEMEAAAREAIDAAARCGATHDEAVALGNLGLAQHESGQHDKAVTTFEAALDMWDAIGDPRRRAQVVANYAVGLAAVGAFDEAFLQLEVAIAAHEVHGNRLAHRLAIGNRGILKLASGDPVGAAESLQAAMATFEQYPHPEAHRAVFGWMWVAALAVAGGVDEAARRAGELGDIGSLGDPVDAYRDAARALMALATGAADAGARAEAVMGRAPLGLGPPGPDPPGRAGLHPVRWAGGRSLGRTVFLSYRRTPDAGHAGRLYGRLVRELLD